MKLSKAQRGWLGVIDWMERRYGEGSDGEGDLSIRTGNYAATHHSLVNRGLVIAEYDHSRGPDDAPWSYTLTDAGRAAIGGAGE